MAHPEDDEVEAEMLSNNIPLQCWFLLDELVHTWDPVNGYFASQVIEDDELFLATEDYLRRRGMVFPSLDAVVKHAAQHGWPSCDLMRRREAD